MYPKIRGCPVPDIEVSHQLGKMFSGEDDELLVEGPAGTGKSYAVCAYIASLCEKHPGIRVLMARKTRTSMTSTILVTWERIVGACRPEVIRGAHRSNRSMYTWPNGSEIVLCGFDDVERIKSSEYDIGYVNEGTEITQEEWEVLLSRLRHFVLPYQQGVIDCNPDAPMHWLNKRASRGLMTRLITRHKDNPAYWDGEDWTKEGRKYVLGRLQRLTGALRARLLHGQWVAAEGAVYEDSWDAAKHLVDQKDVPQCDHHVAGVDWGYRDPGVIQLWGLDWDSNLWRVREIYRTGKTISWWAAQAKKLRDEFHVSSWVCDSARPEFIEQFRKSGVSATPAVKGKGSVQAGIRRVEERLLSGSMKFANNAVGWYDDSDWEESDDETKLGEWVRGVDEALSEKDYPVSSIDEFSVYAYPKNEEGKPIKEDPLDLHNHGMDAMRYTVVHKFGAGPVMGVKPTYQEAVFDLTEFESPKSEESAFRDFLLDGDGIMEKEAFSA